MITNKFVLLTLLICLMAPSLVAATNAPTVREVPPPAPAPLDRVTLKDGGVLYGEVIEMSGGVLIIKTIASADAMRTSFRQDRPDRRYRMLD